MMKRNTNKKRTLILMMVMIMIRIIFLAASSFPRICHSFRSPFGRGYPLYNPSIMGR
jgi:hypothetical protein